MILMNKARLLPAALAAVVAASAAIGESFDSRYMEVCVQKRADRRAHYIAECARPLHQAGRFDALSQCARRIDALCVPGATDRLASEERATAHEQPTYSVDLSQPEPPAFHGEVGKTSFGANRNAGTRLATIPEQKVEASLGDPVAGVANRQGERRASGSPVGTGEMGSNGGAMQPGRSPSPEGGRGRVVNASNCVENYDFVLGGNNPAFGASGSYKTRNKCNYRINAATCVANIDGSHSCAEHMLEANSQAFATFVRAALRDSSLAISWYACRDDQAVFCPRAVWEFERQKGSRPSP